MEDISHGRLLVQIASYNTNLQGILGLPQDLVDWLAPTLQVSSFLSRNVRAPDIVAVGFQELLPLHLGLSGVSASVIEDRNSLILSQLEAHAPNKERYSLVAKAVNVGVALLVYARDDGVARQTCDVHTQWTGCGPAYMGNKGAVGVRFRVKKTDGDAGELFTFVNAHLTAFEHKLNCRIADYHHIVGSLLFPPLTSNENVPSTIYDTSHLFFLGDLNFRLAIPKSHPLFAVCKQPQFTSALDSESIREEVKDFDQLLVERRKGTVFLGLREGDFWKFKCTYKYKLGKVDEYSFTRTPSWTDRILYATHSDSPTTPDESHITNLLYTNVPAYTTSDHKPVVSLLLLPPSTTTSLSDIPRLQVPAGFKPVPDAHAVLKRYWGRYLGMFVGIIWWLMTLLGAGSGVLGMFNFVLGGMSAWTWCRAKSALPSV